MFKSRLAAFVSTLIIAGSSFAYHKTIDVCPSLASIQAEGISQAEEIFPQFYVGYNINTFDTQANWAFLMGPIAAESEEMALDASNELLVTMSGSPVSQEDGDSWICEYNTNTPGVVAYAIMADDMVSPRQLSKYLNKAH